MTSEDTFVTIIHLSMINCSGFNEGCNGSKAFCFATGNSQLASCDKSCSVGPLATSYSHKFLSLVTSRWFLTRLVGKPNLTSSHQLMTRDQSVYLGFCTAPLCIEVGSWLFVILVSTQNSICENSK